MILITNCILTIYRTKLDGINNHSNSDFQVKTGSISLDIYFPEIKYNLGLYIMTTFDVPLGCVDDIS